MSFSALPAGCLPQDCRRSCEQGPAAVNPWGRGFSLLLSPLRLRNPASRRGAFRRPRRQLRCGDGAVPCLPPAVRVGRSGRAGSLPCPLLPCRSLELEGRVSRIFVSLASGRISRDANTHPSGISEGKTLFYKRMHTAETVADITCVAAQSLRGRRVVTRGL